MANTKQRQSDAIGQVIVSAVLSLPQMQGKKLLLLSVVGSRSKGFPSSDSDYDVKAIILHSPSDYLLQNITPSKAFVTSIIHPETAEAVKVEGTLVDYLTMQKYALGSNQAAFDAIFGISIYETSESAYLEQLFLRSYNPWVLVQSFQGLLKHERKAALKQRQKCIKHEANMVYYATMLHVLGSDTSLAPPPHNAFMLLEQLLVIPFIREQIRSLYEQRMDNKSITDVNSEQFATLILQACDLRSPEVVKSTEDSNALQLEANNTFLSIIQEEMQRSRMQPLMKE
jgi:RNA repair pathway DNA polymerase beta family